MLSDGAPRREVGGAVTRSSISSHAATASRRSRATPGKAPHQPVDLRACPQDARSRYPKAESRSAWTCSRVPPA